MRKGKEGRWQGDRKQTSVWQIANAVAGTGEKPDMVTSHGTQKPVACMRPAIENNSKLGDAVYEPFSGSGTTLIAATQTGRRCFALEIEPAYVDVAVKRWQAFSGKTTRLEETGETFDDIAARVPAGEPATPCVDE